MLVRERGFALAASTPEDQFGRKLEFVRARDSRVRRTGQDICIAVALEDKPEPSGRAALYG
jgi:hypothetical protein